MGEMTDGLLSGVFCIECGEYLDGDEPGYPRKCDDCKADEKPKKRRKKPGKRGK